MKQDSIAEIGIDSTERLYVKPCNAAFPYISRESMEVHWDHERLLLHSPKPREWSYAKWFQQIVASAREQSCQLVMTQDTTWVNMLPSLRLAILATTTAGGS